jgi:predicted alpha/beta-fold hydrolase
VRGIQYQRERLELSDGDFLDLDWLKNPHNANLVILSHGLEGDTQRGYMRGMAKFFHQKGWNVLAWNERGCSGEVNRLLRFYHSGVSEDLKAVVDYANTQQNFEQIALIGFSLGGNVTLKYLGEQAENTPDNVKKAVVFSVPLHLSACSENLRKAKNWLYADKFKKELFEKVRRKARLMPDKLSAANLKKIKTLKDFDEYYTAPLHGFTDAEDYYEKSSSLYFLPNIHAPTLIVNAQNDPFLSAPCFPYSLLEKSKNVWLETPRTGGHCGFMPAEKKNVYWSERRAWEFVAEEK